jgi:hypothetical protein
VGLTAALLVPGLGTLFDQFDFGFPFRFGQWPPGGNFFLAQEAVMNDLHGVHLTAVTEIERLDVFIAHDSAGNGRHGYFSALRVKILSAL